MRTYEVIEDEFGQTVKATEGDKILWIPTDPNNSDYAEYLAYTAWVKAKKKPEDFWNQND
jgi:hypothetical protein